MHLQTKGDLYHSSAKRLCLSIVKVAVMLLAHPMKGLGLKVLEPLAVKVARVVLRGVGGGNSARLPDN